MPTVPIVYFAIATGLVWLMFLVMAAIRACTGDYNTPPPEAHLHATAATAPQRSEAEKVAMLATIDVHLPEIKLDKEAGNLYRGNYLQPLRYRLLARLFRPEVAVLLSFLSLTVLLLSTAPGSSAPEGAGQWVPRPAFAERGDPSREARASQASFDSFGQSASSLAASIMAMDSRLEAMDRRLQGLSANSYAGAPSSQDQLSALIPVLLANSRGAPQAAAAQDNGWSYYSTTTTPEWEGQIKSLREAVERLSHQTDDRFSSLMKPPQRSAGAELPVAEHDRLHQFTVRTVTTRFPVSMLPEGVREADALQVMESVTVELRDGTLEVVELGPFGPKVLAWDGSEAASGKHMCHAASFATRP
ncbi:unnamed protein product [Symbiodinium sp. CCMP2592]|nr:unnamed protein product [Symbiodinium sp. CCMP2592]